MNIRSFLSDLWAFLQNLVAEWRKPAPPPPPVPGPHPFPPPPPIDPAQRARLVALLNEQRRLNGNLPPLIEDPPLDVVALAWAARQAANLRLDHGPWYERIASVHPGKPMGENVAEGRVSLAGVVALWMASPGHRANILGDFNKVGVGWAVGTDGNTFYTADFSKV